MFISVVAIAIAANRADDSSSWLQQKHREQNPGATALRGPASVGGKKDIEFAQKDMMKHTHKVRGPLAAVVELVGQRPEQPGDVFVLKGVVSSESALSNVEFSWRVPEGVEVVNGETSSVIAVLSEGKPFETQITLRQVSPSNARVVLRVRGRDSGMRFGDTAVYHTMDQQKLEAARLELKSTTEAYMKGSAGKSQMDSSPAGKAPPQLKIFH
jgi:hypothetical protein